MEHHDPAMISMHHIGALGAHTYQGVAQARIQPSTTDISMMDATGATDLVGPLPDHTKELH